MTYLFPSILVLFSYLLGVYFAYQEMREVINRPLIYRNGFVLITLTILFGWAPLVVGVYLAFKDSGSIFAIILIAIRFLLLPTLLNDKVKSLMNKKGF